MKKKTQTQDTRQQIVPLPSWLQRRMIRNLQRAARNKVSTLKAERAKAVLRTISKEGKPAHTNTPLVTKPAGAELPVSIEML